MGCAAWYGDRQPETFRGGNDMARVTVTVKLRRHHKGINPGEAAGFSIDEAARLVANGTAQLVDTTVVLPAPAPPKRLASPDEVRAERALVRAHVRGARDADAHARDADAERRALTVAERVAAVTQGEAPTVEAAFTCRWCDKRPRSEAALKTHVVARHPEHRGEV